MTTIRRIVSRQQRLSAFPGEGLPPPGEACELLCEDHIGTYTLPYPCQWQGEGWRNMNTGMPVKAGVVAWRRVSGN